MTFCKIKKTNLDFWFNFCAGEAPYNSERCTPNLKMDKTGAQAVIKFLEKKGITPKEIHKDKVQILAEDPSFSATE